ncbi:MAG: alanine:cation symporter family protein [Ruminococcaceae bacterium]|nr:alanine:cation symporter family protein [Oscillospiraceae bacterium]
MLLSWLNRYVILPALPVCLMGAGVWYSCALRGHRLLNPRLMGRVLGRPAAKGEISPRAAMTVALAGTLGVGNIVGVAGAIALGGPGAVFWMWVSALVAMVLKYAEITLALRHRTTDAHGQPLGGAMYYISACFGRCGRLMGSIFALLCLVNAITMGSVVQVRAASSALESAVGIPPFAVGVVMAVLILLALCRGVKGIAALTERLIPLMSVGFLLVSVAALIRLRSGVPGALASIFTSAFTPESGMGGVGGFLLSRGLRYGTVRGLLSNEAGGGTAPIAHASAKVDLPAEQGMWGIVEVFVDTILLCTVTALVILSAGVPLAEPDGMRLTLAAYGAALGNGAVWFLCAAVGVFAYATTVCWAHYGLSCVRWFGDRAAGRVVFLALFTASVCFGAVAAPDAVWDLADFAMGCMTLLNLPVLCIMMPEVKAETAALFARYGTKRTCRVARQVRGKGSAGK